MMRDWEKFDDDEIITMWTGFLATGLPLYLRPEYSMQLTSLEIIKLVDVLIERLEIKMRKKEVEEKYGCENQKDTKN